MIKSIRSFLRNEAGATMVEYGLIAALISIVAITSLVIIGGDVADIFGDVATATTGAAGP